MMIIIISLLREKVGSTNAINNSKAHQIFKCVKLLEMPAPPPINLDRKGTSVFTGTLEV
jgi:hypothetical protein